MRGAGRLILLVALWLLAWGEFTLANLVSGIAVAVVPLVRARDLEQRLGHQAGIAVPDRITHAGVSIVARARPRGHYRTAPARPKKSPLAGAFRAVDGSRRQFWNAARRYQNWPAIG